MERPGFDNPQGNTAGLRFFIEFRRGALQKADGPLCRRSQPRFKNKSRCYYYFFFVNYVRLTQCDLIIHSNRKPLRFYTKRLSQARQLSLTVNSRLFFFFFFCTRLNTRLTLTAISNRANVRRDGQNPAQGKNFSTSTRACCVKFVSGFL